MDDRCYRGSPIAFFFHVGSSGTAACRVVKLDEPNSIAGQSVKIRCLDLPPVYCVVEDGAFV